MRRLLDDAREAGETVASLWASEGAIYGRFGFGLATRAVRYELQLDRVALRRRRPAAAGARRRRSTPAAALERIRPVYDRVRAGGPGMLDRRGRLVGQAASTTPSTPRRRRPAARRASSPAPTASRRATRCSPPRRTGTTTDPPGSVTVRELVAETPEARAGLWRFLLGLDLVRTLRWRLAPDHDPLAHLVDGQRRDQPPRRRRPVRAAARRRRRAVGAQLRDAGRPRARGRRPVLPVEQRPPPPARRAAASRRTRPPTWRSAPRRWARSTSAARR